MSILVQIDFNSETITVDSFENFSDARFKMYQLYESQLLWQDLYGWKCEFRERFARVETEEVNLKWQIFEL